ncbi:MAG TPA: acyl-CoA dehydrogenase family protein [Chloroflexota bacterium]|nr:acyl-CoA dehydrogenase family protein [Chloroflexota bacterium]
MAIEYASATSRDAWAEAEAAGRDLVVLATALADEFRPGAAALDRTGEFPSGNYQRMRETGYLRAAVPTELGGGGAGLAAMARAQQALARGCAATALAVNMHHFQVGFTADTWRKTAAAPAEALLRRIATEGIVMGSTGAEALVPGAWTTTTTAERDGDGYRINGRKYFCSQAPGMDVVRVNALDPETGEILICTVPAHAAGLRVVETWDTTGMRATASHDLVLENVHVPEAAVGARLPAAGPLQHPALAGVAVWFITLTASVYLGIAEEARAEGLKAIGTGINSSYRTEPLTDLLVGQLESDYTTALAVRDQLVGQLDADRADPQAALAKAMLGKEIVIAHAAAVVDRAVELAGGRAYFRRSPLERLARDVRAARFHPPAAPTSYQMIGERVRRAATPAA